MNRHWITLEYPIILERLARYADFSGGQALALALEPVFDLREAAERLSLTTEARALLKAHPDFALGGVMDIRPLAERAQRGVTLQPSDFLRVRSTLLGAGRIRRTLLRLETQFPNLADIAWRVENLPGLAEAIDRVLNDRAEVRDNASSELSSIRRNLRISQDRVQDRLRRIISSPRVQPYLQESLVTRRDGRYVIPVQADFKGHINGIIHDRSSSGATLFMEPAAVVELNNALRELRLAEEEEILRLLRELTATVGSAADEIAHTLDALAELDLNVAKARYGEDMLATAPRLVGIPAVPPATDGENQRAGAVVQLLGARHPLIKPEDVVPVTIDLDTETHVLVITGPNTGGKTVTLKTVGLLSLMAFAGMHIPVDVGSSLSCFDVVVADIGDEQSIEQSLSTFSSHLTNILSFLDGVDHYSLVLIDELGAGTDPAEGAALARALLEALRRRRSTVFVATHYPELKLYAHNTPGVVNASMQFDVETLAPTYKLNIGLPGRSNAFAIARRLGMPTEIIGYAQGMISGEELRAEDMLNDLHMLRIQEAEARDAAREAQTDTETLRRQLRERLAGIESERRTVLADARRKADAELGELRGEIRALRTKMLLSPVSAATTAIDEVEESLDELATETAVSEPTVADLVTDIEERAPHPLAEGDAVRLLTLGVQGIVLGIEGDEVSVQAGAIRTRVRMDELEATLEPEAPKPASSGVSVPRRAASPGVQIDLRGQRVEDALDELDRYLEKAAMADLPWVRIVHGKGTGTLRREVRKYLRSNPLVSSHEIAPRNEGGEGATVAHLVSGH